jgi:hypothetical protein
MLIMLYAISKMKSIAAEHPAASCGYSVQNKKEGEQKSGIIGGFSGNRLLQIAFTSFSE